MRTASLNLPPMTKTVPLHYQKGNSSCPRGMLAEALCLQSLLYLLWGLSYFQFGSSARFLGRSCGSCRVCVVVLGERQVTILLSFNMKLTCKDLSLQGVCKQHVLKPNYVYRIRLSRFL